VRTSCVFTRLLHVLRDGPLEKWWGRGVVHFQPVRRLLARVLKEGVQFWHNDTSTVKRGGGGGGSRKRSPGKPLKFMLFHVSMFPTSFEIFQTHLALWVCATIASFLNYDIFIQPGTPSNWSKCQMYNNNENWSYFVSDILIYLGNHWK
jgi:hypothetical protein